MLAIFLLAVGALAADSEAPVISLDLQNKHCSSPNSVHPGHDCTSLLAQQVLGSVVAFLIRYKLAGLAYTNVY